MKNIYVKATRSKEPKLYRNDQEKKINLYQEINEGITSGDINAGGDDLGNHIATQNIDLTTFKLISDGDLTIDGASGKTKMNNIVIVGGATGSSGELQFFNSTVRINRTGGSGLDFHTDGGAANLSLTSTARLGVDNVSPATKLDVNGAITSHELSADPSDPLEGSSVTWQSDGTGSGDDGDIMMKITAGGVTKTTTLIDFSII